jgi:hypothetical protein
MGTYDPQRSRSRPKAADAEGPAPVDALLGRVTVGDELEPAVIPRVVDFETPEPEAAELRGDRARVLIAGGIAGFAIAVVLFFRWRRRRRD